MRRRIQPRNYYTDPCLTMHQPWASLLVYGIKRIEGRLWIHAASKVPDESTIKAMENFYREIYALDGVTDLKFPEHYPVSKLIGCIEVVGCLRCDELSSWKAVPEGVRLEALTEFCWLSEQPQKLLHPLKMRGDQGIYDLERKIAEAAVRGLSPVENPHLIKFPLSDTVDYLRPGCVPLNQLEKKAVGPKKPPSLIAAIDGAIVASTQYSRKVHNTQKDTLQDNNGVKKDFSAELRGINSEEDKRKNGVRTENDLTIKLKGVSLGDYRGNTGLDSKSNDKIAGKKKLVYVKKQQQLVFGSLDRSVDGQPSGSSLIFSSALKGIRPL
ncbi:uncharacterized protein LOC130828270 isoform X2 [Amaranthus tricolor]|uniref:uncharacterized protein LOC130828270 isoform X2 n=1 Tax=Amaranthus tricolor TaxID=29722 RepID=UPI002584B907|nr:uncharacterized protein LOC130828270 isoform X2 [Amaranthus tricolor]